MPVTILVSVVSIGYLDEPWDILEHWLEGCHNFLIDSYHHNDVGLGDHFFRFRMAFATTSGCFFLVE
jgi:hypothetical protein